MAQAARGATFRGLQGYRQDNALAGLEQLGENAAREGKKVILRALEDTSGRAFFSFLFGNSPHLSRLLLRDLEFTQALLTETPDSLTGQVLDELSRADSCSMSRDQLMRFLRSRRSRVAVLAAVYDCFEITDVMACARLLTRMADHAVRLSVQHLLMERVKRGDLVWKEGPGGVEHAGYFVLAMGKHGSCELNYSSDIDLIVLYDPRRIQYTGNRSLADCFLRVTQDLVNILQSRTGDGYVFRTDLRLRPDASSTPVAITVDFALDYYQRLGRTWERAAMIKARPVAGDLDAGQEFLGRLAPFVWDQAIDFSSVEDIRSMSQQIHDFHGHGAIHAAGHNVKLGRGGIREIEFFVNMHQLAFGGRSRNLRGAGVLAMLDLLVQEYRLMPGEAADLRNAYLLLRRIEHRLQMVNDEQTQTLPSSEDGLEHLARFMGMSSREQLQRQVEDAVQRVHALYKARFNVPESERDITVAVLEGPEGSPDALPMLKAVGFSQPQRVLDTVRTWAEGRHASLSSERARTIIREILHEILASLGKTPYPDRSLARMDGFFKALPSDLSFLTMLRANTWLLNLVAVVMGSAPRIADTLGSNPEIMQAVLEPSFFLPIPDADELQADLEVRMSECDGDAEKLVATVAAWTGERQFQLAVQTLQNLVTVEEASAALSRVAELTIATLLNSSIAEWQAAHGNAPGTGIAVLARGQLGAGELNFGSALELVFLTDLSERQAMPVEPDTTEEETFHCAVARRLLAALQWSGSGGALYQVELLPPHSSESAPLVITLEDFLERHVVAPQTERLLSLTRSRALCGNPALVKALTAEIQKTLTLPRDPELLRGAIARLAMPDTAQGRTRDTFAFAQVRGGLKDLELIADYLQLLHGHEFPEILAGTTGASLEALARCKLISEDEAQLLLSALHMQRSLLALLNLAWGENKPVSEAPQPLRDKLADALEYKSFEKMETGLRKIQSRVYAVFQRHIGAPPA
ncbi:MAG: bifunctional [glutamine synthetase] adenylyltransferase/[glutamine synthetase]-adenylyl-L-tyrosine phosphorylase [Halieaceae bacterium]|nr:bifunctional [glutamine synthetase] adenylyltransferase/[glutamine synthetase]-adenylyl-L-tyrosine phosphorylase [Halieaceae bacterium]